MSLLFIFFKSSHAFPCSSWNMSCQTGRRLWPECYAWYPHTYLSFSPWASHCQPHSTQLLSSLHPSFVLFVLPQDLSLRPWNHGPTLQSSWGGFFLITCQELNWITFPFEVVDLLHRWIVEIHFVFYSLLSLPLIPGWKGATSDRTAWSPATSGTTCLIVDVETGWRPWSREPGSSTRGVWRTP